MFRWDRQVVPTVGFGWNMMQIILLELPRFPLLLIRKNCTSITQKCCAKPSILTCGIWLRCGLCVVFLLLFHWWERMICSSGLPGSRVHAWHRSLRSCARISVNSSQNEPWKLRWGNGDELGCNAALPFPFSTTSLQTAFLWRSKSSSSSDCVFCER